MTKESSSIPFCLGLSLSSSVRDTVVSRAVSNSARYYARRSTQKSWKKSAFVLDHAVASKWSLSAQRTQSSSSGLYMEAGKPGSSSSSTSKASSSAVATPAKNWTSNEIREAFLKFYETRTHKRIPSSSLIPEDPTILLTIAGMVQFKPIFLGLQQPEVPRATTTQKCIRTNDIENVGVTKRHHTFFEMLGNFSFGDYFKKDAIAYAYELITKVYGIPKEHLAVSVYEKDDEAFEIWKNDIKMPENRIKRMGEKDNFWASGPTGPCGGCSEIYWSPYNLANETDIDLEDDERFLELYNLVFMQYNRDIEGNLTPLKNKNIDTGMGLERMCQVLQQVPNNYETDLMKPLIDITALLCGKKYSECSEKQKTSMKVIADHTRAVMHLVTDGVRASNMGRGYICRRLVRRIIRHGRQLGIEGPFISKVLAVAVKLATEAGFTDCAKKHDMVRAELEREESRFLATLDRGEQRLSEVMDACKAQGVNTISGEDAFELYDTFGFPLELTQETALENGMEVDNAKFEVCMEEQRQRARAAHETLDLTQGAELARLANEAGKSEFLGYTDLVVKGPEIKAILVTGGEGETLVVEEGQQARIFLNKTPFYAEGGGQVGDRGLITVGTSVFQVQDVKKEADTFVHVGVVQSGALSVGDVVVAEVNEEMRRRTRCHHTATHLLQSALRKVLGPDQVSQAGSLVDASRLRFDFNSPKALTNEELIAVEDFVNTWIQQAHSTTAKNMPLDEAVKKGAIAMFGEKYNKDNVRVIDVPGVSMELCGGTHVSNTSEIGLFKILSESGIASGVRRIEAVCGTAALEYLRSRDDIVKGVSGMLKARPEEIMDRIGNMVDEIRSNQKDIENLKNQLAFAQSDSLLSETKKMGADGKFQVLVTEMSKGTSADMLKAAAQRLTQKLGDHSAVLLGAKTDDDKLVFVGSLGAQAVKKGAHAGKIVGSVAKLCGGNGGGRPDFAQAGGKESQKLRDALELARSEFEKALN